MEQSESSPKLFTKTIAAGRATVPHLPSPPLGALSACLGLLLLGGALAPVLAAPGNQAPASAAAPDTAAPGGAMADRWAAGTAADAIAAACLADRRAGALETLAAAQARLRSQLPLRPSLDQALAGADALLACGAPDGALAALARVSPAPGPERRRWLAMQWRAAHAGLHHAQAAQALRLLAEGDPARLETLMLPVAWSEQGREPPRRAALDLLADHLESLGEDRLAAEVLLAGRLPGAVQAARWGRAASLGRHLASEERQALIERALEQAAAAQAWGLVAALLDQQLAAGTSDPASSQALERRLRLGARIDDAYGEWLQRRHQSDAAGDPRLPELERQLRSPRAAAGHAVPAGPADNSSAPTSVPSATAAPSFTAAPSATAAPSSSSPLP